MSDILAKLKSVHQSAASKLHAVPVPEYDDTWYFRPMTLADQSACRRGVNLSAPDAEQQLMVNALIHMARDAEGKRVFDLPASQRADLRAELHKMSPAVMLRITIQGQGGISESGASEIAGLDEAQVRAVLGSVAGERDTLLSAAVEAVDFSVIQEALGAILIAGENQASLKNV